MKCYFFEVKQSFFDSDKTIATVITAKNKPATKASVLEPAERNESSAAPIPANVTAETKLIKDKMFFIVIRF